MPELPDVEIMKKHAESTSLHKKINHVEVKDEGVLDISPQTLRGHIENHKFEKTKRTGKRLFISVSSDQWLMLHFGMTGNLKYKNNKDEEPEYSRVLFHFNDNTCAAYTSKRKLGSIDITESPQQFKKEHQLGEDALKISKEKFENALNNKRSMIKTALMDQNAIAGIGNVYADEILHQSRIHPKRKTDDLKQDQLKKLYKITNRIFKTAINNQADPEQMPDHYLITNRAEEADCPDCDGKIKRIKVGSRSAYFCAGCQRL